MSIERDITHHGTGVLAWCAWNERRQRQRPDNWRIDDIIWLGEGGTLRRLPASYVVTLSPLAIPTTTSRM